MRGQRSKADITLERAWDYVWDFQRKNERKEICHSEYYGFDTYTLIFITLEIYLMLREMSSAHTHTYATPRSVLYIRWWTLARERFTSFPCIVRKGKSSWETQAASNSDGNESSATDDEDDEETRKSSKRGGALRRSEESKKKKRNRRKLPTIVYTDAQLSGLLKDVIDKGEYRCPRVFFFSSSSSTCIRVFVINESALVARMGRDPRFLHAG